jgi:5-methylcytosine-specific restriction protein A
MYQRSRKSSYERGYTADWRKARLMFLKRSPLCVHCHERGEYTPATDVDHIIPHRGDREKFWDVSNWQPLCKSCHTIKSIKEDGRWG